MSLPVKLSVAATAVHVHAPVRTNRSGARADARRWHRMRVAAHVFQRATTAAATAHGFQRSNPAGSWPGASFYYLPAALAGVRPVQTSDWMIDETLATCEDHADADADTDGTSSMLALFFSRPVSCPVWVWPSRTMLCLLVPCPVSPTSPSCSNGRREH